VLGVSSLPFGDEDETGEIKPAAVATTENPSTNRRRSVANPSRSTISHPPAYRSIVADWPVEWRERWGRRANALEENGLSWRDAETQAFVEVWNQFRGQVGK
jgi:hypothetical protein